MRIIRGFHNLKPEHRGSVATIGNFDGVHLGHRAVLERLRYHRQRLALPSTVILFEPQPLEFFTPQVAPARLTRLRDKLATFGECGVDRVVLMRFGAALAAMPARDFADALLIDGLGVRYLLVGDDFRFGRGREGDFDLLRAMGEGAGFEVEDLNTITHFDERISSTRIRGALARGDLDLARRLLGHPYRICGRVGHGQARGRSIGYPTANVDLKRIISPVRGVFAVWVQGVAESPWPGVANVGNRPTVGGDPRCLLEVHLFDYAGDLYGRLIRVEFALKLRDERRFESFDALKEQIDRDAAAAREYLAAHQAL